jgi:hypothetical protein
MMRNRYPHTSDPETLKAQRGAALAKSIAAVAVVCAIAGLASLSARDVQRTDSPRAGETVVVHAAASAVESTAPQALPAAARPVASDELQQPSYFDPNAVDDYRATAQY